ncbi:MAG: hypothetical protein ACJ741_13780 [Pyrinomonadaceae bacterium]
MKAHKKIIFGVAIGIVTSTIAAFAIEVQRHKSPNFVPYTITWRMREQHSDGSIVDTYMEKRYYSSDGNWRGFIQFNNGFRVERVAESGRGVFIVDPKTKAKRLQSPFPERGNGDLKKDKHYTRSEPVLGHNADVLKFEHAGATHELYRAADLNGDIIKTVYHDATVTRTLEPVSIVLGEPPPN